MTSRIALQLVVGLALGVLTASLLDVSANGAGEPFRTATIVAAAASTTIAPRLWWAGLIAFWIGQSAGWYVASINDPSGRHFGDVVGSLIVPYFVSAQPMLIGALLGGALWSVVDWRRKRCKSVDQTCSRID